MLAKTNRLRNVITLCGVLQEMYHQCFVACKMAEERGSDEEEEEEEEEEEVVEEVVVVEEEEVVVVA
jgi:hypothetical protein